MRKRRNIFWYFLAPIVLEWGIAFIVRTVVEMIYMVQNYMQFEKVMNDKTLMLEFMNGMLGILNQYAAEITTVIAICTIPFLIRMYRKDKKETQEWWNNKKQLEIKDYTVIVILAICVCVAANNFILLSGITRQNEVYQETSKIIYESPVIVQFIGLGIIVPIMEEMIYRGLLYRRMREYLPMVSCVLGTALLFGIYHGNAVQMIYAALLGSFLAYLFEIFRTVKAPALFHIVANLTSMIFTWVGAYNWIFSSIFHVTILTVAACVIAAGMFLTLKKKLELQ